MLCPKCGQDKHPTIELGQATAANAMGIGARSGAVYVCGNGACHADLGPVKPHAEPIRNAPQVPPQEVADATAAHREAPVPRPSPVQSTARESHIDRMRARLAELAPLAEEFELLQKALRAVDREPRKARKSNVVSLKSSAQ